MAVLLLVTTGSVLLIRLKPESSGDEFVKDWFWAQKTFPDHQPDIIIYGDSRTYRGIDPDELLPFFSSALIHNMAYSSGGMNDEALQFVRSQLNPESEHPIVILGITPYSLSTSARLNEQMLQERRRPAAQVLERKYTYPLLSAFEPFDLNILQKPDKPSDYIQEFRKNGWVRSYKIPEDSLQALSSYRKQFRETGLDSSSVLETLSFVEECMAAGIAIFAFRPPSTRAMEMLEDSLSGFDEAKFAGSFKAAGGVWIDIPGRYSFHSYDGSHLHYDAAARLTKYIGWVVKENLSGLNKQKE